MDDPTFSENVFRQMHDLWIKPQIERRKAQGKFPADFHIRQCLVKLPLDHSPIVLFNEEVGWEARVKVSGPIQKHDPVYLHHVQSIETVKLPRHDDKRCAFFYLYIMPDGIFRVVFDAMPNWPNFKEEKDAGSDLGKAIAESLQAIMTERAVRLEATQQAELRAIGLWPAPALLPYPLSKILLHLEQNDAKQARALLVAYCTPVYLEGLVQKWWSNAGLAKRRRLLEDALSAHKESKFTLSVSALMPHVEGIVSDWIAAQLPGDKVPFRQESKTKKFKDVVKQGLPPAFLYARILEATIDFILSGPVTATFKKWGDTLSDEFANRHAFGHGKYEEEQFSEENSIKLFLLLDTLFYVMEQSSQKGS